VVHSCVVDDGNGDTVQILNEEGCALDKFLLNNLEYPTDLMAGQEAHVYKYADRSQLFYQCQISITIKEPNSECARPKCAEPTGFNAVKVGAGGAAAAAPAAAAAAPAPAAAAPAPAARPAPRPAAAPAAARRPAAIAQLRLLKKREAGYENTLDVRTEFNALDIVDRKAVLPESLRHRAILNQPDGSPSIVLQAARDGICMSTFGLSLFIAMGVAMVAVVVVLSTCFLRSENKF
jgi:hypothetical protein